MEDEDYQRHLTAVAGAADEAIHSLSDQGLPLAIWLPEAVPELGPRNDKEYRQLRAQETGGDATLTPSLVSLAVRLAWYSAWETAHYIRRLHEQLPSSVPLTEKNYQLWEPSWHIKNDGLAGNLVQTLASIDRPPQLQLLLRDSPIKAIPPDAALYLALSMYCYAEAAKYAAAGQPHDAFDMVFEAHQALQFRHGESMWQGGAEHAESEMERDARSALAKKAAAARHSENRAMKQQVFEWCDAKMAQAPSMDTAASQVAGVVVPVAWRTVRDWMTEWKKLRSAGTA